MNAVYDNNRDGCNSVAVTDPRISPATAAVENLKFFSDREWLHLKLLSEGDGDEYYHDYDHDCYHHTEYFHNKRCSGHKNGSFDMTALSRASESISAGFGHSMETNAKRSRSEASSPLCPTHKYNDLYSLGNVEKDSRDILTKQNRRLVRCLACFRLAQLDSSSVSGSSDVPLSDDPAFQ